MYQGLTVFCHGFVQASCKYKKVYFTRCLCKRKLLSNGSITDHIFWICQVLEKNKGTTMRQCIEFKEAHDSVRCEVLYNILTEFGIPMKW